jgi:hypothetical protein
MSETTTTPEKETAAPAKKAASKRYVKALVTATSRATAGGEEAGADLAKLCVVDRLFLLEDLQVDEVVRSVVAVGPWVHVRAGMELLSDLVLDQHERDRCRLVETDGDEDLDDVVSDPEVAVLGAADLVVPELELHRQPVPTLVGESDLERLHHVVGRDVLHLARLEHADGAGEPAPAALEAVA